MRINVKEDQELMRDGEDLIHRMRISFVDAALGAEVDVPTLEGPKQVRVDPGTQPGATLTLRGDGMPRLRRRGRGDLKVVVDVMVPTRLTAEQRDLLERFEATSGEETYNGGGGSFFDRLRGVFGRRLRYAHAHNPYLRRLRIGARRGGGAAAGRGQPRPQRPTWQERGLYRGRGRRRKAPSLPGCVVGERLPS